MANQIIDKALAYVGNNMQTKANLHNMFTVEVYTISFSVSSGYAEATMSVTKSGYTMLGVVGWAISSTYYCVPLMRVNADGTFTARIRHVSDTSASATVTGYAYILYVKNT